jgi:transcriptional regulator with PAS, ATPase and Fis domain
MPHSFHLHELRVSNVCATVIIGLLDSMNNDLHSDEHLTSLIGTSVAMLKTLASIAKVGPSRVSVLIQGESGTGKELVARAIYHLSPRGKFVPIDCGALAVNLVESELFGHVKGAFTGAADSRLGLLESAHEGTAFFDEVGEMPPEVQSKLLRVLQQHEVRPLGTNRARPCSFRVIAATNRDLATEVENHRFRLDLYYRLNVVTLEVPALRDHPTDIPLLVAHFLRQTGRTYRLGARLMENLQEHVWPGNVRELQNCVARLVAFATSDYLDVADLPFPLLHSQRQSQGWRRMPSEPASLTVVAAEHLAICRALQSSNGNTTKAAKSLGISRTTLYRRRKGFIPQHPNDSVETAHLLGPYERKPFINSIPNSTPMPKGDTDGTDPVTAIIRPPSSRLLVGLGHLELGDPTNSCRNHLPPPQGFLSRPPHGHIAL